MERLYSLRLVVSVPISLLWRIQISIGQKLSIGAVLCLSIFTIIVNVIGISFLADAPWTVFWSLAEACIGVIMASMRAVRILLVSGNLSRHREPNLNPRNEPEYKTRPKENNIAVDLPTTPAATLVRLSLSSRMHPRLCDRPLSITQKAVPPRR